MPFFGRKKETPDMGEAIQRLCNTEELLRKKTAFLEKKIEDMILLAKKHGSNNKRAALQALTKKRRFEEELKRLDGALTTIEFQRQSLESATTNKEVLDAMRTAAKAQKAAQNYDTDQVHDVLDEIREQQELAKEISDVVANPIGFGQDVDEDELLAELEELEQQDLNERLLKVDAGAEKVPDLPQAPQSSPSGRSEEEEMKDLEAWAA